MMFVLPLVVAHFWSAGSLWTGDTIRLDTLATIGTGDTLRIKGPTHLIATKPTAGLLVRGVFLVAGDDSNRVGMEGGKGIEVGNGGSAFLSGLDLSNTTNGLFVNEGEATVWDSRIAARAGRPAVALSGGTLVMVRSRLTGNAPLVVGWKGDIEFDDVVLRSDTLWRLSPSVNARFQDVEAIGNVRIGQDPTLLNTHAEAEEDGFHLRWTTAPTFGTRNGIDKSRQDVATLPFFVSIAFGNRFAASLLGGWRSAWLDNRTIFNERDQTMVKLQYRILPGVELGLEGGYGGSEIHWDREKANLAIGLVDRGMDLEEPFAAPGPLAGGRIRLLKRLGSGVESDVGIGYQWRGTTDSTDLGDLINAWIALSKESGGARTGFATSMVWCLPDRVAGIDGSNHWQWNALADHRRNGAEMEWGTEIALEARDDEPLGQRIYADAMWGAESFRFGPAASELASFHEGSWSGAAGPGGPNPVAAIGELVARRDRVRARPPARA